MGSCMGIPRIQRHTGPGTDGFEAEPHRSGCKEVPNNIFKGNQRSLCSIVMCAYYDYTILRVIS